MVFICAYTGAKHVGFLAHKNHLIHAYRRLVTELGAHLKTFRTDQGTEYVNKEMKALPEANYVRHVVFAVNEHYSNGVAEHAVHTVRATAKAMLLHANIPKKYWCYAISLTSLAFPRTARSHASTRSAAISRTKGSASQVSKGHSLASHTIRKHWTTASRTEHAYHAQGTISHSIPTSTLSS